MSAPESRDRIIETATGLFAVRGYDATTTRAIGEAAGLNIATVAYHVGSKADLYREVMHRVHLAQSEVLAGALGDLHDAGPDPAQARRALLRFADDYLDFCVATPEIPALWMRRWLDEAGSDADAEARYARPLASRTVDAVREVLDAAGIGRDVDVELLVWTMVWTCHSFCLAGILDQGGGRHGATDPVALDRFRAHLHQTIAASIGAPGSA